MKCIYIMALLIYFCVRIFILLENSSQTKGGQILKRAASDYLKQNSMIIPKKPGLFMTFGRKKKAIGENGFILK
ncbi:MAG TPA: hypothetical protein DDW65_16815 [Firmicutes bacterium]|nr:hypothetical protein [Bacillota bacterium]